MSPRFSFISPENVLPPHNIVCIIQYKELSFQTVPFMEGKNIYIWLKPARKREKKGKNTIQRSEKANEYEGNKNKKQQQQEGKSSIRGGRRQEENIKFHFAFFLYFLFILCHHSFVKIILCVFYRKLYSVEFLSLSRLLRFSITRGSFIDTGLGFCVYCVVYFTVLLNI